MNQYIVFGVLFTIAGFLFACGKGHVHLKDWENMSIEEREKIDIKPLCRNIGEVIMLNGLIFLIKGLCPQFSNYFFIAALFAWMIVAGIDVFYIERGQHYYK